jgi:hypothetical protein
VGQLPAIIKELKDPDALNHIGGVLSWDAPLCAKLSSCEMDLYGWISGRDWKPNKTFCPVCVELYRQGMAWQPPSNRK